MTAPEAPEWVRPGADALMVNPDGTTIPAAILVVRNVDGELAVLTQLTLKDGPRPKYGLLRFTGGGAGPFTRGGRTLAPPYEVDSPEYLEWLEKLLRAEADVAVAKVNSAREHVAALEAEARNKYALLAPVARRLRQAQR